MKIYTCTERRNKRFPKFLSRSKKYIAIYAATTTKEGQNVATNDKVLEDKELGVLVGNKCEVTNGFNVILNDCDNPTDCVVVFPEHYKEGTTYEGYLGMSQLVINELQLLELIKSDEECGLINDEIAKLYDKLKGRREYLYKEHGINPANVLNNFFSQKSKGQLM